MSPENAEKAWKNELHPKLNKGKWTADEDEKLTVLVSLHREAEWDTVARDLGVRDTIYHYLSVATSCTLLEQKSSAKPTKLASFSDFQITIYVFATVEDEIRSQAEDNDVRRPFFCVG